MKSRFSKTVSQKLPLRLLWFLKPNFFTLLVILNCSSCAFLDQPNVWRKTPDFKFKRLLLGAIVGKFLYARSQTPLHNNLWGEGDIVKHARWSLAAAMVCVCFDFEITIFSSLQLSRIATCLFPVQPNVWSNSEFFSQNYWSGGQVMLVQIFQCSIRDTPCNILWGEGETMERAHWSYTQSMPYTEKNILVKKHNAKCFRFSVCLSYISSRCNQSFGFRLRLGT